MFYGNTGPVIWLAYFGFWGSYLLFSVFQQSIRFKIVIYCLKSRCFLLLTCFSLALLNWRTFRQQKLNKILRHVLLGRLPITTPRLGWFCGPYTGKCQRVYVNRKIWFSPQRTYLNTCHTSWLRFIYFELVLWFFSSEELGGTNQKSETISKINATYLSSNWRPIHNFHLSFSCFYHLYSQIELIAFRKCKKKEWEPERHFPKC